MKTAKVLTLILAFSILSMIIAPAIADSPRKIPATVTLLKTAVTNYDQAVNLTTPSGIVHRWNAVRTVVDGKVQFTREGMPTLFGSIRADLDLIQNPNTLTTTQHYHKWHINFVGGSFIGVATWKANLTNVFGTIEIHAALQGDGVFEGQTLCVNSEPGGPMSGYLLIH